MFFILGLPRSRTAWLANLFCYGPCFCYHDPLIQIDDLTKLRDLDKQSGAVHCGFSDPGLTLLFPQLVAEFPFAPRIVVHRPLHAVRASCERVGIPPGPLEQIDLHAMGGLQVSFEGLSYLPVLESLWWFATGSLDGWNPLRAKQLIDFNVQSKLEETRKRVDPAKVHSLFGRT